MKRGVGALFGLLLLARVAGAQAMDTVELRSGGVVRGTIVELLPGDHVTVQLQSGMKTFQWGEISRVERAGSQPQVQGPQYTTPANEQPLVQPGEPSTRVYIDASSPVSMFRMDNHGDVKTVCIAPCGEVLPFTGLYWVSGKDINPSEKFQLPPGKAETKLRVSGGSKGIVTGGVVLAVVGGGVITFVGLPGLLIVGAIAASPTLNRGDMGGAWATIGVINGVGLALGIVGLVMWLSNNTSSVEAFGKSHILAPRYARTNWMGGF
jgi:hypothetical protein